MYYKFLAIFMVCFLYKFVNSLNNLCKICKYKKLYCNYLSNNDSKIFQYKTSCIALFKQFNISDAKIPITQKTGYGCLANFQASLYENFPDNTTLFAPETDRMFQDAIGICKSHILECFSIKYWIDCILFLPKKILIYLNVPTESIFIKFFQIIYWLAGLMVTLFSNDIAKFLKSLIQF